MRVSVRKPALLIPLILSILVAAYYFSEPWTVTFLDDGPYYMKSIKSDSEQLALLSTVKLHRFGHVVYVLESRSFGENRSLLQLLTSDDALVWQGILDKPDGDLGSIAFGGAKSTWYGGWIVTIRPTHQEVGRLYIDGFGQFRFFNHSW